MNRKLLYALIAGGATLALLVSAVIGIHAMVSTTTLRGEIEKRVAAATGRNFKINGPLSLSVFPTVGLTAHDVTLANVPGGHAKQMVRVEAVDIHVKLLPLLNGKIETTGIVLEKPVIALEVAADGTGNWELVRKRTQQAGLRVPSGTTFAGVTIRDGAVSYDNDRLGLHRAISDLDGDVDITTLGTPVSLAGTFEHRGRHLNYKATVATLTSLLAGRATKVDVSVEADFIQAGFLGFISSDGTAKGAGTMRTRSLKEVAAWLGRPIEAGNGLGGMTALAQIAAKDRRVVFTQIQAKLDGMAIAGTLTADVTRTVPTVSGTLNLDRLDLNTYLSLGGPPVKPGAKPARAASGPPSGGWSKAAIKLDLLKLINGKLILNTQSLTVRHLKLGKTTMSVALADGVMEAHLDPIALYGGTGKAFLVADARGAVPAFKNRLTFANIGMKPFLIDAIGVTQIDARGTIVLDVASSGASPDAIMRGLSGKGSVVMVNGHIRGVNMGQVARTVQTLLSAGATGDSATTDFDRFSGSFAISRGMLWNGDLKMSSAFLNMTGQGHLDLGNQTIRYRIEPKAAVGGRLKLFEIGVPFAITGTWAHVRYQADVTGAVTGVIGGIAGIATAPITGLIDGLTGGGQKPAKAPPPKRKSKGLGGTLKDVFGLH